MAYDVLEYLQGLFDVGVVAAVAVCEPTPSALVASGEAAADDATVAVFLGWVRRQDAAGRWGWESPELRPGEAWWRDREFEALPEPPADFRFGAATEPTRQDCASCEEGAAVDTLHLPGILP